MFACRRPMKAPPPIDKYIIEPRLSGGKVFYAVVHVRVANWVKTERDIEICDSRDKAYSISKNLYSSDKNVESCEKGVDNG